jgi:hypothetical protein
MYLRSDLYVYEISLRYAISLDTNALVHIDSVPNGLDCNCMCPHCKESLVAKNQGNIRAHHFAHIGDSDCKHSYRASLLLLTKKILSETKHIPLPGVDMHMGGEPLIENEDPMIEDVEIQQDSKQDAGALSIRTTDGSTIFIIFSIVENSDVDEKAYEHKESSALEIDLSDLDHPIDEATLKEVLLSKYEIQRKRWLNHQEANKMYTHLIDLAEKKMIIPRGMALHVDDCPKSVRVHQGKSYANVRQDCLACPYGYVRENHASIDYVLCLGRLKNIDSHALRSIRTIENQGKSKSIVFVDGSKMEISANEKKDDVDSIYQIWKNRETLNRGLVKNVKTGYAVFFSSNPLEQYKKYNKIFGAIYRNGQYIGNREIFGAADRNWYFIEKDKP